MKRNKLACFQQKVFKGDIEKSLLLILNRTVSKYIKKLILNKTWRYKYARDKTVVGKPGSAFSILYYKPT